MMKSEPVQLTRTTLISFCGPVHHRPLPPPLKHPSFTAQGWGQGSAAVPHLHKSWTPAHLATKFTLDVCFLESAAIHSIISSVQISNCIKSALSDESLFEEDTGRLMTHDIYFFHKQFAYCYIHPVINWPAEDHSVCPGSGNLTVMSINFHWSFEIGNKKSKTLILETWDVKVRESIVELKLKDSMLLVSSGSGPLDFSLFHLFSKVKSKRN